MNLHKETFYTKKNINNINIAIFSDLHYHPNFKQKTLNLIENQLTKSKPDYIAVLGDILDDSKYLELDRLISFFKKISLIAPVIIVTGNHDEKTGKLLSWEYKKNVTLVKQLEKINNIHVLNDSTWTDNNITFYGFNLSYKYYHVDKETYESFVNEVSNLKTKLSTSTYNITLCHSPINIYEFLKNNPKHNLNKSDLILSGHTHNGCLPFWFTNIINKTFKTNRSIIAPKKKLFPKYAQGRVYKPKEGYIYEGITKLSLCTGFLHYFNFIYKINIELLSIKKDD